MVTCSYCKKELAREAFCTPSHKMAYRRNGRGGEVVTQSNTNPKLVTKGNIEKVVQEVSKPATTAFRNKACPKHKIFTCGCKE